ncbi:MAG: gamma-glutamylcyclotransferase, partial [Planctomycetota bacterium]|nr:gamma-glutamylcyclotransferase [Planctomycetota bacterium]
MPDTVPGHLPIFAYGTLKQGFRNHAAYCRGAVEVHPADTWGRLYVWQPGIPILHVPDDRILLTGTQDRRADIVAGGTLATSTAPALATKRPRGRGWRRIQGELLVFPDAVERLRLLDAFEGVHPMPAKRTYERVLLPVRRHSSSHGAEGMTTAWAYVLPAFADMPDVPLATD